MADKPIERDNPLTRHLNAIAALNAQHGVRAEGGSGVPLVPESATVVPPAPQPITPEEEAELKAAWEAEQQAIRAARAGIPPQPTPPAAAGQPAPPASQPASLAGGFAGFNYIDLIRGVVIADNGQEFMLNPVNLQELKGLCFNTAIQHMNLLMVGLAEKMGLALVQPQQAQKATEEGKKNEAVQPVSGTEAPGTVPSGQPQA